MKGYHNDGFGYEWAEVNGSEGSAVYQLIDPNHILVGKHGGSMQKTAVPAEFLEAGGQPPRPGARQAEHGLSLRSGLGVRLGDRRRPRRRSGLR